jgi:hypothetical protein
MTLIAACPPPPTVLPRASLLSPVRRHFRLYLAMNAVFYGLVLIAMLITAAAPSMQSSLLDSAKTALRQGILKMVADAYIGHHLLLAIVLTFGVNLILGSVIQLHLPSMIIPYLGLLMAGFRALMWGVLFSPFTGYYGREIVEGQAYVLAMLAICVQSQWVTTRAQPRVHAYFDGLLESIRIYKLIAIVLLIAAIYEACEVIYLAPLLK